jgi:RNA polymerase sigma-70 factor (ECF subfamily)
MGLEADTIVQSLLRERLRVVAAMTLIVRDVHMADDLFQQVVMSALEHKGQIRDSDHLLAWALRAARHRAIDSARRKQLRQLPTEILDLFEAEWGDPAGAGNPDQVEALWQCMGKLGEPARDLLRMKYFDGLTATAIATQLQRSPNAVHQSLSRLHRSLRNCVEQQLSLVATTGCERRQL